VASTPVHYVMDDVASTPVHYVMDDVVSTGTLYDGQRGRNWRY
jgi:hypothetical protein